MTTSATNLLTDSAAGSPAASRAAAGERMHIVVTGHVDHGKSSVIGRLLADSGSLPEGKLEAVRATCERNAKPFEYAFLLDALKDEQAQGITIDAARVFFKTERRHYLVIDAPGHVEFLKNMISGASRAEAALLVIDAHEGVKENSRRHGFMLSMLGIRQVVVLVNKMDLIGYSKDVFDRIVDEYSAFLANIGLAPSWFIPVSAVKGENLVTPSPSLAWYDGPTVLQALDEFENRPPLVAAAFRMPVQGVYKFTENDDNRRIVAGTVESGRVSVGDEVVFYPSGKKSRVKSIEAFNRASPPDATAGEAIGFTMTDQIYVGRGEIAALTGQPKPLVSTRLNVSLFWLGSAPFAQGKEYLLKLGSARVPCHVERIHRVIDASELSASDGRTAVERHEVADCTLRLGKAIAFDLVDAIPSTGRFVIVDNYEISGGGIVREAIDDDQAWLRDKVLERNYKWDQSGVSAERRMERYSQKPTLVIVTGERETDRKGFARELEARLFEDGRLVYFLGMGNVLYGVDADIERTAENRQEHLRRLGEIAHLLLDAGLIVVAAAAELTEEDLGVIRTSGGAERVLTIWIGDGAPNGTRADLLLTAADARQGGVHRAKALLAESGAVFRP